MSSTCPPLPIPLYRPWLFRLADQLWARSRAWFKARGATRAQASELYVPDLEALRQLSPRTLRDIGAPEWLQGRAAEQVAAEQERLQRWLGTSSQYDTRLW